MTIAAEEEMRVLELQLQEALEHIEFLQDQQAELLDALEAIVEAWVDYGEMHPLFEMNAQIAKARAVIAKAKGEQP